MIKRIKKSAERIRDDIHFRIFGSEMGNEMRGFIKNISVATTSIFLGGIAMIVINILSGRIMGPSEYGKYQLVYSIAFITIVFVLFGTHLSVARQNFKLITNEKKQELIGTSFWFVLSNIILISIFLFLCRNYFVRFNISENIIMFAILFSVGLAMERLIKGYYQAEHDFKFIAKIEIANYTLSLSAFILFIFLGKKDFEHIVYSLMMGYSLYIIVGLYGVRKYLSAFSFHALKKIVGYGILSFAVTTSGLLISNFDRIILNNYMGEENLGVYSAYYLSSTVFIAFLIKVTTSVLFPTIAKLSDKSKLPNILNKIEKIEKIFILPLSMFNFIAIYFFIKLFGEKFDFNINFIILTAISSSLFFFTNVRQWFLAATGNDGIKISLKIVVLVAILSFFYYTIMVSFWGLQGAFYALFLVNLTFFVLNKLFIRNNIGNILAN